MITYTLRKMAFANAFSLYYENLYKDTNSQDMIENLERKANDNSRRSLLTHSMTVEIRTWRAKLRLTKLQKLSKN